MARSRPYMKDLFFRIAEGSKVTFPENNVTKCGNAISAAPDRASATQAAETAIRSILIRLEPADRETASFLAAESDFPPGAFQIGPELRSALNRLPDSKAAVKNNGDFRLIAFPELSASGLCDYVGRTVAESLCAVRSLTGLSLPEISTETHESSDNNTGTLLGRSFWAALIRGGYQGGVYYIDSLGMKY